MKKFMIYLSGGIATLALFFGALGLSTRLSKVIQYIVYPGFWGDIAKTWWVWALFVILNVVIWCLLLRKKTTTTN